MKKEKSWQPVIGMEVHVQPKTKSKMFCGCVNDPFCKIPNMHTCPVCTGQPGSLPVVNKAAVEAIIRFGLALNCKISNYTYFARKSYFYPDLPKGYQISQYDKPVCERGKIKINGKVVRITRIHLEEDAGKLFHPKGTDHSLVDLNRAGVPLIELVTEADIEKAEEARKLCQELQLILRYLGISDADMEKGQMRCEANISLIPKGSKNKLAGTKVEVKNLNSFKVVERSIDYEVKRQKKILERGEKVIAETRGWSEGKQATISQRTKEEASDYRYFPEPDIPPLEISRKQVNELKKSLRELPDERRKRFKKEYNITPENIKILIADKKLGEFFENAASELQIWWKSIKGKGKTPNDLYKLLANYIVTEVKKWLTKKDNSWNKNLCTPENLAEMIVMLRENKINSSAAQTILGKMLKKGGDPSQIAEDLDLIQISDDKEIEAVVEKVVKKNPKAVEKYKNGEEKILQFLVGQVMKETKGKADPRLAQDVLKKKI